MMKTFTFNKIVRNRIPGLIAEKGGTVEGRSLSDAEAFTFLGQKALEELVEMHQAVPERRPEELADSLEVTDAFIRASEVQWPEVELSRQENVPYSHDFEQLGKMAVQSVEELQVTHVGDRAPGVARLLDVMDALVDASGVSRSAINEVRQAKLAELGGFAPAIYVETATVPDDDYWATELARRGYQEIAS